MAIGSEREYEWDLGGYGFRLAPQDLIGGEKPHEATPIEFLAQQISSTAEATYTDINRKGEFAFAQDDVSGGLANKLKFGLDTQKRIRWAKGIDTSWPFPLPTSKVNTVGAAIGAAGAPTLAVQRGNITYIALGTQLWQIASSTSTPTIDSTFPQAITALFLWSGFLIVGQATNFYYYRTGDTASSPTSGTTAFTTATSVGTYFATTGDLLYKTNNAAGTSNRTVAIADGINGPWAEYDVGDSQYAITSLGVEDQVVIVGKEDGPYVFDLDFVAQPLIPELRTQADPKVCAAAIAYNRDYYVSTRLGVIRIRPSEGLKQVGLDVLADPALPNGYPTISRFTTDGRFLYGLVFSSTGGVYIWKMDTEGNWHNFQYRSDLGESGTMLQAVSKIGSTAVNAILFAYKSGANWQVAYARFPATLDPTKDTAFDFETAVTGFLRTLDYSAAYPTVPKVAANLKSVGDYASQTRKVTYSAWIDDETASRAIAEFQKSPFDEVQVKSLPQFHRISLEIGLTAEATKAQKLKAFHLSCDLLPRVIRLHRVHFIAETGLELATGGASRSDWAEIVEMLRRFRASRKLLACEDENGFRFDAYIEDVTEWDAFPRANPGNNAPTKIVTATIKEIAAAA